MRLILKKNAKSALKSSAKTDPEVIHVDDEPFVPNPLPDEQRPVPLGSDHRINVDARIRAECVEFVHVDDLVVNQRNAKQHPEHQIALLQGNFEEFGFTTPLLVDERSIVIAGHARLTAAKRAGFI